MNRPANSLRTILALVLALLMCASLFTGCNKKPVEEPTDPVETIAPTNPATEEPTEAPTEEPTEAPTEPVVTVPPVTVGTVNSDNLNVRTEPSFTADILKRLAINTQVEILEQKIIDGDNWGRIADGWISMNYITIDGEGTAEPTTPSTGTENDNNIDSKPTTDGANATVTADGLNIRKSADADSEKVGSYVKGDRIIVLEKKGNWGKTALGWINLKYVKLDGTVSESTDTGSSSTGSTSTDENAGKDTTVVSNGKKTVLGNGVVEGTSSLAIRTGPGTNYAKVGFLRTGESAPYYQVSGKWVRISKGWVSTNFFIIQSSVAVGSKGTVTTGLNIREEANSSSKSLGEYKKGDEVTILEVKGNWGKTDKGWISLSYVSFGTTSGGTSTETTYKPGKYVVNTFSLNIRKEANASSADLGNYMEGDKLTITEVSGIWGKTDKGWVNMKYLKADTATGPVVGGNTTYKVGKATVLVNTSLTIRKEADAKSEDLGSYKNGDKVEILEVKDAWGKTDKGWINLKYVVYEADAT